MGRTLSPQESQNVEQWIELRSNRQLFKFVFGCGDDRVWSCHICRQQVRGRYTELRKHCYEEHHEKLQYSCELCPKRFTYIRLYKRHLEKHFNSNSNVDQLETVSVLPATTTSGSFVCEKCGRVLKQKNCKYMFVYSFITFFNITILKLYYENVY